jgi:hypothetical protein
LSGGKTADPAEQRREIFAVDVLHGDEGAFWGLADVVDAAFVRVRHLAAKSHLGTQPIALWRAVNC